MNCSFCWKSELDVKVLVIGPNVTICDECVAECVIIIYKTTAPSEKGMNNDI